MRRHNYKILLSIWLLTSLFCQTLPLYAQSGGVEIFVKQDEAKNLNFLFQQSSVEETAILFEKLFGKDAGEAQSVLVEDAGLLSQTVSDAAGERAVKSLDEQIETRKTSKTTKTVDSPVKNVKPVVKPKSKTKKISFNQTSDFDRRRFVFGFQTLAQDEKPVIKMTETDKEIKVSGEDKKSFETKDARGTRTQKAETRYIKDGKTFGVEINNTQIIEAVSKPDGKSFRQEISLHWGAEVAACPDAGGVSAGTGGAKVMSKTTYSENGETFVITTGFDLQAKLKGYVDDKAVLTHYDMEVDAYTTNSGHEAAFSRKLTKEIKLKDGRYGLHLDIKGNTIEVSDGKYGGYRKPAKMGNLTGKELTPMNEADGRLVGSAIGPMIPSIWNSANEMYKEAQRNWQNYGCVEVVCKAPKSVLKAGEEISISAESVIIEDKSKINSEMEASAYPGTVTPDTQSATPSATFTFTQEGEDKSSFMVTSISKRGIGRGEVEFTAKKEDEEPVESGVWTGTLKAERTKREEREKRSGANLAENGGYLETVTTVELTLTGKRDTSEDATNVFIGQVAGRQEYVDYEYDRYKIDEGYCGPSAVPYKGPKEITRTSRTTATLSGNTRVYFGIDRTSGSISFSLPESTGRTVHSYVHQSPCADHDRANTNEAVDEDVATAGGSFSVSFPADGTQKSVKGSTSVRDEDGTITVYTWEFTRK
jgi:hypothetical protein